MELYKKIKNWLLYSSTDPEQIALTVKGLLITGTGGVIAFLALVGVHITPDTWLFVIQQVFIVVGPIVMMIGLLRKVLRTLFVKKG